MYLQLDYSKCKESQLCIFWSTCQLISCLLLFRAFHKATYFAFYLSSCTIALQPLFLLWNVECEIRMYVDDLLTCKREREKGEAGHMAQY